MEDQVCDLPDDLHHREKRGRMRLLYKEGSLSFLALNRMGREFPVLALIHMERELLILALTRILLSAEKNYLSPLL